MRIGIVLTGGESQRMGRAKAELPLRSGQSAGAAVADCLAPIVDEVVVVGTALRGGNQQVIDDPRDGPLSAIAIAARQHPGATLLVCTCDAPFVPRAIIDAMLKRGPSCGVRGPGGPMVFPALISAPHAAALIDAVDDGERRARWLIDRRDHHVDIDPETADRCRGANTPEMWAAMCARYDTDEDPA